MLILANATMTLIHRIVNNIRINDGMLEGETNFEYGSCRDAGVCFGGDLRSSGSGFVMPSFLTKSSKLITE